jgi:outer membrane protein assembly factor BamA
LAQGQKPYSLEITASIPTEEKIVDYLKYEKEFENKSHQKEEIQKVLFYFYDNGYLTARFDSIVKDSNHIIAYLFVGKLYKLTELRSGNVEENILREAGYKNKSFLSPSSYSQKTISRLLNNILCYCENNGYPFASILLDSIQITGNEISAALNLSKNNMIILDSIIIKGNTKINIHYIYQYFGIKPGDLYNESRIRNIKNKLKDIPFVSEIKPFEITFTGEDATLFLYLDKKKASQFDGIIGLAPNDETTGKLMLTGDVKLRLLNIFNRGELIDFNWRKIEQSTQDLKFNFVYPYLFNTPFGFDYSFYLFKKDTSYLTVINHIGIQYLFRGYNFIKAYHEYQVSSLISTSGLEFATTLPSYADVTTSYYGLELGYENFDYHFNPHRGYYFNASGAIGDKKIKKNDKINPALYDSLDLNSTQYRIELDAATFIPVLRNLVLMFRSQNGYLNNPNLFNNELFRIGGLKTLRGFDEESILVSMYSILTCEFRYFFDVNSYFSLFWNGAYYEKSTIDEFFTDRPFGFGAGLSFETKAGIFSVSYALGKQFDNPILFRSAKIHFGLIASF